MSLSEFNVDRAKAALNDILDAINSPENSPKVEEAKENAGNDMLKMMQFVFPIITQIEMEVIQKYGFAEGREGIVQFAQIIRTLERDDQELALLHTKLAEFQSSSILKQKFIDLRSSLESLERDRLHETGNDDSDNEILNMWNSIPETFDALKKLAKALFTIFSSTYSCETLFSALNNIQTDKRNRLVDDVSAASIALKCTNYTPAIKELSSKLQQQKSH